MADRDTDTARPWPVVLLTALGAWLAAIPLLGVLGIFLHDIFQQGSGAYIGGVLFLTAAVTVLRARDVPIFFEQLAVPALLVGGGSLAIGLFRDLPEQSAGGVLCAIALGIAYALPRAWLRVLLGALAANLAAFMLLPDKAWRLDRGHHLAMWIALHGVLLIGLGAMVVRRGMQAALADAVESIGVGWILAVLAALAFWSGMTFLVAGTMGGGLVGSVAREIGTRAALEAWVIRAGSVVFAVGAMVVLGRAWPSLRNPGAALVGVVLTVLAGFMSALGGVLLVLAWAAVNQRWRLAGAAALAAAWIVGAFYYQLQWALGVKALVLVAAGVALGAVAWFAGGVRVAHRHPTKDTRGMAWVAVAALFTLAVANWSIWEKEDLIARGQKVYVRLAPVDPRSLMQGDFMRLNYSLPDPGEELARGLVRAERLYVAAKRDAQGVVQPVRVVRASDPRGDGEMRIELTPQDGRWVIVSDAWYFREGDAARWNAARYAELRVLPDGRALLVGLANDKLEAIAER